MNTCLRMVAVALGILACSALVSCSQRTAGPTEASVSEAPTGIHELVSLYERAVDTHNRDVRKPVRDEQRRALRLLAAKADAFLAETDAWNDDARLTSLQETRRDHVQNDIQTFRNALQGIEMAAKESDLSRVRSEYAEMMDAYRHLAEHLDTNPSM